jgi:serine/threonine protein kinase
MTNDEPPKACLADFGFTTMVFDPYNPMSSSFTLEGGTMTFMAPELLVPSKYGLGNAVPTKEGDIYAFGLVILQVAALCRRNPATFLNNLSGPDRRATVSWR